MEKKEKISKEEAKEIDFINKVTIFTRKNLWKILSVVLIVVLVLSYIFPLNMSKSRARAELEKYLNDITGGGVVVKEIKSIGGLYEATITYQGQDIPIYMTKDGKYMIPAIQELNPVSLPSQNDKEKPSQNVPKTSKPKVELYVWSYCPYGVQMQGPMAEVAELLKGKAEFIIVPYYDGHGAYETQQNKIQLCIQKLAEDKYWSYAKGFVETIYSKCGSQRTEACDKNESISLMKKLGIDSSKIMSCVDSQGKTLLEEAAKKSQQNGVSGSPTVIINGVKVNVARTPESVKTAVCSAFENVPAECSKNLSSSASASSGSC